jgi:hypothetical protein
MTKESDERNTFIIMGSFVLGGFIALIIKSRTGNLDISSNPLGAEIFIDGMDKGKVTKSIIPNITAGNHSLTLKLAGYQDYNTTFNISAGATTTFTC